MSVLLDRLVGYDIDEEAGKTKLGIHPVMDAVLLAVKGWTGAPTNQEINQAFQLKGQSFDPLDTQVDDLGVLAVLPLLAGAAQRSVKEIEAVLRLAEQFPNTITKQRVEDMLGVTLSS